MSEHRGSYIIIQGSDPDIQAEQAERLAHARNAALVSERDNMHRPGRPERLGREALIRADLLAVTARRLEIHETLAEPDLRRGRTVIGAGNWLTSAAEHGVIAGMGIAAVRNITREHLPPEYMQPTFTAMLYTPDEKRDVPDDAYTPNSRALREEPPYVQKLESAYDKLTGEIPPPFQYIDQSGSPEEVEARIAEALRRRQIA